MTAIPALGPVRALQLHAELGIGSVSELTEAVKAGRLRDLKGFGPKSEERILRGIELLRQSGERVLLSTGLQAAEEIIAALSAVPGCLRCTYAGSLRRMRETAGDVDILAAVGPGPDGAAARLTAAFTGLPGVAEVIGSGGTKTSVRTNRGLQVDLRVVPDASWGAALQYFTGSQAHNVRVREIAVRLGLRLSEYGLFRVETGELIASQTEEEIYHALGMSWVPPTLREDGGEVEAALRGELPGLVSESDLRGDLHTHTDLTDGVSSLEDMVAAAANRGYEYYAITDHAPDLVMHRMTDEKMLAQRAQVRRLGAGAGMTLLHGSELNIGPDGSVDWPPGFLAGFDICVASVHSHFGQSAAGDDPAVHPRLREPVRQRHRAPADQGHRPPGPGGRRPRRGVRRVRQDRDGAGDQRLAAPARPPGRARPPRPPGRRQVRRRQRRALDRPARLPALRRGSCPARLAHRRRRHQHLAPRPPPRLPAQGPLGGGDTLANLTKQGIDQLARW